MREAIWESLVLLALVELEFVTVENRRPQFRTVCQFSVVVLRKNWFLFSGRSLYRPHPVATRRETGILPGQVTSPPQTPENVSVFTAREYHGEKSSMQLTVEIKGSRGTKVFFITRKHVVLCLISQWISANTIVPFANRQNNEFKQKCSLSDCPYTSKTNKVFAFIAPDRDHCNVPGKYHRLYPVTPIPLFSGRLWQTHGQYLHARCANLNLINKLMLFYGHFVPTMQTHFLWLFHPSVLARLITLRRFANPVLFVGKTRMSQPPVYVALKGVLYSTEGRTQVFSSVIVRN